MKKLSSLYVQVLIAVVIWALVATEPELATAHHRWQHKRLALHARLLGFEHPITHQPLRFEAALPGEMEQFIRETKQS